MKAVLMGLLCAAAVALRRPLLESIHQQLVLIEQHTRPAYQLTK